MASILIVDDHEVNRQFLTTLLGYKGHQTLEAADGVEALALVKAQRPELIICDILMPTMDGYEFVRRLRGDSSVADTNVIFYTAHYHDREAHNLAKGCGVMHILTKPSEPQVVLSVVERALGQTAPPTLVHTEAFNREHVGLLTDKLSEKAAELQSANERLAALIDLNLQLASELDQRHLLDSVCRGARELVGAQFAALGVDDKLVDAAVHFTTSGLHADVVNRLLSPSLKAGLLGNVIIERKTIRSTNPGGQPTGIGLPKGFPPVTAFVAAPISSPTYCYGWICLTNKLGSNAFSEDDEKLLSILGAQAGRIYENGSLYGRVQRHATELGRHVERLEALADLNTAILAALSPEKVAKAALEHLKRLVPYWGATVMVFDLDANEATVLAIERSGDLKYNPGQRIPLAHYGLADLSVLQEGRMCLVPELAAMSDRSITLEMLFQQGMQSYARIPLIVEGVLVGALNLAANKPAFFTQAHLDVARAIADQFAIALQQALLRKRIERLNRVHAVLSGINSLIVRVHDRDELFREACRIAVDAGAFRMAWIGVIDPQTQDGKVVAWYGGQEGYVDKIRLTAREGTPDSERPACRAVRQLGPVICDDVSVEPSLEPLQAELIERGHRSLACLPLMVAGQAVGVLALFSGESGVFDDAEMRLLLELAGDISFAIDHIAKGEKLNYLAYYDTLTGLANVSLFREHVAQYVTMADRTQRTLAVLMLDIDHFKTINDSLGRPAGDALLQQLGQRLLQCVASAGDIARISADHFAAVLPVEREADVAHSLETMYQRCFLEPFLLGGTELLIAAKLGIALYPSDGADAETLLRNAEAALKKAKARGEKHLFYTQEMTEKVAERLSLENKLRRALMQDEFVLHYQPKVNLKSGRIAGLEALIRWQPAEGGLVPPGMFIPLLEETGLLIDIGRWVMEKAATDYWELLTKGLAPPRIAINVSAIQLRQREFIDDLKRAIEKGDSGGDLDIEVTESLLMEDMDRSIEKLYTVRDMGINIALDDFGTGFSSLSYLVKLPINCLKIDRTFITNMTSSAENMAIVSAVISLAHSLDLTVVAEGVETEEQANILRLLRCDEMQGYLFSRPVPLQEIEAMLSAHLSMNRAP